MNTGLCPLCEANDFRTPSQRRLVVYPSFMDAVAFTRQLVDIESITGNEAAIGDFLYRELCRLGYQAKKVEVEDQRFNVYATSPENLHPVVCFSTHMDTVPPFIPSSEDAARIYGRGSCDAKGIIAAQIAAAERLRQQSLHVGMLFVVGEERDSLGAKVANEQAAGCKYLINPGSVGQPRDGDPRAAYAIVDTRERRVELLRVKYPVEAAQAKIIEAGLPEVLAQRLAVGR